MALDNALFLIVFCLFFIGLIIYCHYHYNNNNRNLEPNKVNTRRRKNQFPDKYLSEVSLSPYSDKPLINVDDVFSTERSSAAIGQKSVDPVNLVKDNPAEKWDSKFGIPLIKKEEKQNFVKNMQKKHQLYEKSLGQFSKHQTDKCTVIKTDVTIDPFKSNSETKGRAIKDIYDQQTANPKAKPKKVKKKSDFGVVYEDESEINGGSIKGTNLQAFDQKLEYKHAVFDNEF